MSILNPTNHLLTYAEVAEMLGLKPNTLRVWVSSKKIPCVKLGGAVRFTPSMVQDLIESSIQEAIR
ncbi:MAG: helix-turn-helix domain-containing protein [Sphaerochaetaceae bacterium]|nr:helix-turn-helix domain-containing protein [Sphaerochaetaceae bacterium]MDD4258652.1 helix-turn-helix domain-containing protein [Sphaerochaetaceae bacterium]